MLSYAAAHTHVYATAQLTGPSSAAQGFNIGQHLLGISTSDAVQSL